MFGFIVLINLANWVDSSALASLGFGAKIEEPQ